MGNNGRNKKNKEKHGGGIGNNGRDTKNMENAWRGLGNKGRNKKQTKNIHGQEHRKHKQRQEQGKTMLSGGVGNKKIDKKKQRKIMVRGIGNKSRDKKARGIGNKTNDKKTTTKNIVGA